MKLYTVCRESSKGGVAVYTRDDAVKRKADLEKRNPGQKYKIVYDCTITHNNGR